MLVLFGVLACTESKPPGETGNGPLFGDDSSTDDSATDDSATESSPDDSATETGDSGTDDSATSVATVSDLAAAEHPVISSIVVVTWTQDAGAKVSARYSFDAGATSLETPTWTLGSGDQRILLLGIPYDTDVTWSLVVDGKEIVPATPTFHTGSAPSGLPEVDDVSGDPKAWDPTTRYVLTCYAPQGSGDSWSVVLDRQGRVVWALPTEANRVSFQTQPSYDGKNILVDYDSFWGAFDGGDASQVVRFDIEGTELDRYDTPGMAHPFAELPDGSIIWGAIEGFTGESLQKRDPYGVQTELFDCEGYLNSIAVGTPNCGSNAISWNESTGTILYSNYSLNSIFELDTKGDVLRTFGEIPGSYTFADSDTTFYWQHGAYFLPDGHLLLSTRETETANETVVREYEIGKDELTEVWSFGEGEGVYARIMGEARRLPGGNTLHNYGTTPRFREATPKGDVVWDLSWRDSMTVGHEAMYEDLYGFWSPSP
jgi:hypothetical protein